jgi:hypothetical protein
MVTEKDLNQKPGEIPERIKKDAPKLVLRPDGSWRALANQVDRVEIEKHDAAVAKRKWGARVKEEMKQKEARFRKIGLRFNRSARW